MRKRPRSGAVEDEHALVCINAGEQEDMNVAIQVKSTAKASPSIHCSCVMTITDYSALITCSIPRNN